MTLVFKNYKNKILFILTVGGTKTHGMHEKLKIFLSRLGIKRQKLKSHFLQNLLFSQRSGSDYDTSL